MESLIVVQIFAQSQSQGQPNAFSMTKQLKGKIMTHTEDNSNLILLCSEIILNLNKAGL